MSLRLFLTARDRAEANGRQLVLTVAGPPVRRVFELTGFESLLVEAEAKERGDADVPGEIVERIVKETDVAAEPGSSPPEGGDS